MTLAAILILSIFSTGSLSSWATPTQAAQASVEKPPQQDATPPADAEPSTQTNTPGQAAGGQQKPSSRTRTHHKKKVASSGCPVTPAPATTEAANPSSPPPADATTAGSAPAQNSGASSPPKPCTPPKTIVRHGGTAEPSIQLAGGAAGSQNSPQRDAANQLLGSTEENLKKLSGQQLSAAQEDTVTQIRQFMAQSKAAVADGDMERARTLAWKAETLSEDLVKPPK
jgi:hypothetical protein